MNEDDTISTFIRSYQKLLAFTRDQVVLAEQGQFKQLENGLDEREKLTQTITKLSEKLPSNLKESDQGKIQDIIRQILSLNKRLESALFKEHAQIATRLKECRNRQKALAGFCPRPGPRAKHIPKFIDIKC